MTPKEIARKFAMGYVECLESAENLLMAAERDQVTLANYGISTAFLTAMQAKFTACQALKRDDVWVQEVALKNMIVYTSAANLRTRLREIVGRAQMQFGDDALQINLFRTEKLSQERGMALIGTAQNVVEKAGEYLAELDEFGLTQAVIDDTEVLTADFNAKRKAALKHADDRRIAGQARVVAYNALFDDMRKVSHAGKLSFVESDPARYADYLLYDPSEAAKTPPDAPVIVSVENGIMTLETDETTTSNHVQESSNGQNWTDVEDNLDGNTLPVEPPPTGTKYFRARSRNAAGFGEWSEVFALAAMLDAPSNPHYNAQTQTFEWGAAANATHYQLRYRPLGSNVPHTEVFDDTITSYGWTPPVGEWEFEIRSHDLNGNFSPWVVFEVVIE